MIISSNDRWTCPTCNHTEHLQVVTTVDRARARLRRVRADHGRIHADEARRGVARDMRGRR